MALDQEVPPALHPSDGDLSSFFWVSVFSNVLSHDTHALGTVLSPVFQRPQVMLGAKPTVDLYGGVRQTVRMGLTTHHRL